MDITQLIKHPELMDRETLYELRSMLALHPYYQTARLLMLQNLYLLHDSSFDQELRRAAIYITDRKVIFQMIEAAHYQLRKMTDGHDSKQKEGSNKNQNDESRTVALIDTFLDSIPQESTPERKEKRRPTPADAAIDYVAYLLETEAQDTDAEDTPQMKGQDLIDNFLEQERGRIMLNETSEEGDIDEETPENADDEVPVDDTDEEYFTETLARIYIKQGRFQKALEITRRLCEKYPQKNAYFADQIRFLEKLVINSKNSSKYKK